MAARNLIPLLTGGALITAALAVAYARRPAARPQLTYRGDTARFAPDPVGPDDGMVEMLRLSSAPPSVRSEAEAMASANAIWPAFDSATPADDKRAPRNSGLIDEDSDELGVYRTADYTDGAFDDRSRVQATQFGYGSRDADGFSAVEPDQAFLDLDIEFDELEAPTDRDDYSIARELETPMTFSDYPGERMEAYDAMAPEDVGVEWLARATEAPGSTSDNPLEGHALDGTTVTPVERMDTLEDIEDLPTDPVAVYGPSGAAKTDPSALREGRQRMVTRTGTGRS